MYAYIIVSPQYYNELAAAEFHAFTGCEPEGRIGFAPYAVDISRAALISTCIEIRAQGASLDELCTNMRLNGLAWDGFRIEPFCPSIGLKLGSVAPVIAVANAITGRPNLSAPRVTIGLIAMPGYWAAGPVVKTYSPDWTAHENRPNFFSASLPTRFSRAMVNIVASPGDSLIDPCCGVGVALIEALATGVNAVGCDINPRMCGLAAENLIALGFPQRVFACDARQLAGHWDAAVIDLPYGRNTRLTEGLYGQILQRLRLIATRIAVIAARELDDALSNDLGLRVVRHVHVKKNAMTRHLHIVTSCDE